jgi:hypothetical protein
MKPSSLMFTGVLVLCGCANMWTVSQNDPKSYTPAALDGGERVATLANMRYGRDTAGELGFNLRSVDGVSVMTRVARDQLVYLNPGRHIIEIECVGPRGAGWRKVAFEALPGEKYEANGRIDADRVEMWIQLINSNQVASNSAGFSLPRLQLTNISGL